MGALVRLVARSSGCAGSFYSYRTAEAGASCCRAAQPRCCGYRHCLTGGHAGTLVVPAQVVPQRMVSQASNGSAHGLPSSISGRLFSTSYLCDIGELCRNQHNTLSARHLARAARAGPHSLRGGTPKPVMAASNRPRSNRTARHHLACLSAGLTATRRCSRARADNLQLLPSGAISQHRSARCAAQTRQRYTSCCALR